MSLLAQRIDNLQNLEDTVIVKVKEAFLTFEKRTYNEFYFRDIISKEAYDAIISTASKRMGESWMKKISQEELKQPVFRMVLIFVALLLSVIYAVLLYCYSKFSEDSFYALSFISGFGSLALILYIAIDAFFLEAERIKSLDELILENMNDYMEELNHRFVDSLCWSYIPSRKWIQITLKKSGYSSEIRRLII